MSKAIVLIALILVDAVSKVVAYLLLPENATVRIDAPLQVVLMLNTYGVGMWAQTLAEQSDRFAWSLSKALTIGALACSVLLADRLHRSTRFKVLLCAAIVAATYWISTAFVDPFIPVSHRAAVFLTRASQSALWLAVWGISAAGLWEWGCSLMAASALGNFLSLCYPPFAIIDFLYSSIMRSAFGLGVFNLADLFYFAGLALLGTAIFRWVVHRIAVRLQPPE